MVNIEAADREQIDKICTGMLAFVDKLKQDAEIHDPIPRRPTLNAMSSSQNQLVVVDLCISN
jgi:hypothetical protein